MYPQQQKKYFEEEEEEDIYTKVARAKKVDDDALRYEEDGFMQGYEEGFDDLYNEDLPWLDEIYPEELV